MPLWSDMKVKELTERLEGYFPASMAEDWDNVGLLVGDDEKEVHHVFLALDLTETVLSEAIEAGADMIITHHPMIFGGLKKINNHDFTGKKVISLIRHDIQYFAMHTNYDVMGMADLSAEYLKLQDSQVLLVTAETEHGQEGFGRVGRLPKAMSLRDCALFVKEALGLEDVRFYGNPDQLVETAAVCTGSGKSMIPEVLKKGVEVYITGDIDHHTGIDAVEGGLAVIDAGHYGTEYIFAEAMKQMLEEHFPELKVSCARIQNPYTLL